MNLISFIVGLIFIQWRLCALWWFRERERSVWLLFRCLWLDCFYTLNNNHPWTLQLGSLTFIQGHMDTKPKKYSTDIACKNLNRFCSNLMCCCRYFHHEGEDYSNCNQPVVYGLNANNNLTSLKRNILISIQTWASCSTFFMSWKSKLSSWKKSSEFTTLQLRFFRVLNALRGFLTRMVFLKHDI